MYVYKSLSSLCDIGRGIQRTEDEEEVMQLTLCDLMQGTLVVRCYLIPACTTPALSSSAYLHLVEIMGCQSHGLV